MRIEIRYLVNMDEQLYDSFKNSSFSLAILKRGHILMLVTYLQRMLLQNFERSGAPESFSFRENVCS